MNCHPPILAIQTAITSMTSFSRTELVIVLSNLFNGFSSVLQSSASTIASRLCLLLHICNHSTNNQLTNQSINLSHSTMPVKPGKCQKRLRRELERLTKDQIQGCAAQLRGGNILQWEAYIEGPADSPFAGGIFHMYIDFPNNYPIKPPKVTFKTKIYHCNIASNGSICLDILKGNWSPVLTIQKVLLSISSLLTDPNAGMLPTTWL